MTPRHLPAAAIPTALALACVAGCRSPLFQSDKDYDQRVPVSRLREIERLEIDGYSTDQGLPDPATLDPDTELSRTQERVEEARSGFQGRDLVQLKIEDARAATLQNNLDLRVFLIDPLLEQARVSEEEGRFDALISANARIFNNDQAVALSTQSGQVEGFAFTPGLTVPLRSGGEFSVQNTFSETDQDNPFLILNPSNRSDLQLSLSQPLLRGGGRRATTAQIRIADLTRQAVEASTKLQVITSLSDAERAYWNLYRSIRALEVRLSQYDVSAEQLGRARRQFDAGRAAEIEIIRAGSGLADRVDQIISAERDVLLAQRELKRILNIPGLEVDSDVFIEPQSPPIPTRYEFDGAELADLALDRRMELLELELRIAADEALEALRTNDTLPLLTTTLTYRINSLGADFEDAIRQELNSQFTDWEFGVNAEIPLTNAEREARLEQALLTRLRRLGTREARRISIRQEVLDVVDRLNAGWQRLLATRQAVALNTRTLEAEQRQFQVGRSTTIDVLDADSNLAEARLAEIQALVDYQINQIDLAVATGTLLGASRVDWEPMDPRDWTPENAERMERFVPDFGDPEPRGETDGEADDEAGGETGNTTGGEG
ncbi:MAG: TolC family protein [Planctomycetota bacterium]